MSNQTEAVKATAIGSAAGGAVVGGVFLSQGVATAAIPTLMSAEAGTLGVAAIPAITIGGVAGAGYLLYKWKKKDDQISQNGIMNKD